jgi:hypothetical protein
MILRGALMGGRGRAVSWAVGGTMIIIAGYYLVNALFFLANFAIN